jgi:hypothetical protein
MGMTSPYWIAGGVMAAAFVFAVGQYGRMKPSVPPETVPDDAYARIVNTSAEPVE